MIWFMMSFVFIERRGGRGYFSHSPWKHTQERLAIFVWNLNHANKTSLETFCHTQVWNLKFLSLTIVFFLNFLLIFLQSFFPYSINYVIKAKHFLLELKAPWPISAISETYNRGHNIFQLEDVLPNVSFTTSETETDCYY